MEELKALCEVNGLELVQDKESEARDFKIKVISLRGLLWSVIKGKKIDGIDVPTYVEFGNKIYLDFIGDDNKVFIGKATSKQR